MDPVSQFNDIHISTDRDQLDLLVIQQFLTNAYWAKGRTLEEVAMSVNASLNFGVYKNDAQIGFARVLTDYAFVAYLLDVFILEEYRGNGYSKLLMTYILDYPDLQRVSKWMLATEDAHGLYARFGFKAFDKPERWMERIV